MLAHRTGKIAKTMISNIIENNVEVAVRRMQGHAGIEAALACARLGVDHELFTPSLDAVANMPCNPSIGGGWSTGKSYHLVYEIDALGSMKWELTLTRQRSKAGLLNLSKGGNGASPFEAHTS